MTLPIPSGLPLFAQETAMAHGVSVAGASSSGITLIPILLIVLIPVVAIVLTAIILGIRYARRERELEHAERLKALETGQTLPGDAPFWTPNKLCLALGVVMPASLFLLALAASDAEPELLPFVWPVAGALGGIGIICGTLLALILPRVATPTDPRGSGTKVSTDPDAYDVASSRGWAEEDSPHGASRN